MASKKGTKSTESGRKVGTQVACHKCRSIVDSKDAIMCSMCKNTYEFDCAGFSEKLYRLMRQESRKNWKCKQCIQLNRKLNMSDSDQSNVTTRKRVHKTVPVSVSVTEKVKTTPIINKNICEGSKTPPFLQLEHSSQSFDSQILDSEASTPEKLSRSLDHTIRQHSDATRMEELKQEINQLKLDLMSTQNEFENTIIENNDLKKQINKLTTDIEMLRTICKTPPMKKINLKKKKQNLINSLPSSQNTPNFNINDNTTVDFLQKKITYLEKELQKMEMSRQELYIQIENLKQESNEIETNASILKQKHSRNGKLNNIYIFGDQQATGWSLDLVKIRLKERKNVHEYNIFGSIKPNAVTKQVTAISTEIENNTNQHDYVVISIGSNDYNPTKLIADLTVALSKLSNTNVIVTSTDKNPHLNEKMLNSSIRTLLTCFDNCCFVDLTKCRSSVDKVHALNKCINAMDYNKTFLNYNTRKYRINNTYLAETSHLNCTSKISKNSKSFRPNKSQVSSQSKITDYFTRLTKDSERHCDTNYGEENSEHSFFRG